MFYHFARRLLAMWLKFGLLFEVKTLQFFTCPTRDVTLPFLLATRPSFKLSGGWLLVKAEGALH